MAKKETKEIILSPEEKGAIEAQRRERELLEKFQAGYQALVNETGFGWVVDVNSPLNNPQLGITKVKIN
jgi:hypothetical protein